MSFNYRDVSGFKAESLMLKDFQPITNGANQYSTNLVIGFMDNVKTDQVLQTLAKKCEIEAVNVNGHCVVVGSLIIEKVSLTYFDPLILWLI